MIADLFAWLMSLDPFGRLFVVVFFIWPCFIACLGIIAMMCGCVRLTYKKIKRVLI
jgi:hypothetical protein